MKILFFLLLLAAPAFAQFDSIAVWQSNNIIQLEGEIRTRSAMLDFCMRFDEMKDSVYVRHEREDEAKRIEAWKVGRTWLTLAAGVSFILLIIIAFK